MERLEIVVGLQFGEITLCGALSRTIYALLVGKMVVMSGKSSVREKRMTVESLDGMNYGLERSLRGNPTQRSKLVGSYGRPTSQSFQPFYFKCSYFQSNCYANEEVRRAKSSWICGYHLPHRSYCINRSLSDSRAKYGRRSEPISTRTKRSTFKTHQYEKKSQASAPENTTQFLMNDLESRYKKYVYSEDSNSFSKVIRDNVTIDSDIDAMKTQLPSPACKKEEFFCESAVKDKMPFTFDKTFGLMEFENLYESMNYIVR